MSNALSFQKARQHHAAVESAAWRDEAKAEALWNAITGTSDDVGRGSYAEAVRDTFPEQLANLLGSNVVAAAFALDAHAQMMHTLGPASAPIVLRDRARSVWAIVTERADNAEQLATGFGWDLSSAWEVSNDVQVHGAGLATVEAIAKMAGRMYASLRGENAKRLPGVGGEIYSVEQGNNVGRLLAAEQVLFMDPLFEITVLERVATRRAMQYAVRGTDKASRGPLVVLIDESGSMRYDADNQLTEAKNIWAKSAAVAMARVAKDEGRPFEVVHYSTSCVAKTINPASATDVLGLIRHFLGGGTDTARALKTGLDEVNRLAAEGHKGADLILLTDGIDPNTDGQAAQVERAKAENVRLWTVAVECEIEESSPLRQGAAGFTRLGGTQLADPKTAAGLARAT